MIVLVATTPTGHGLAFKVAIPPTADDLDRIAAIKAMPGVVDATWSIKPGGDVRRG